MPLIQLKETMKPPFFPDELQDRRAFMHTAMWTSLGLAAGMALPLRLAAQAAGSPAARPSARPQPESNRRMAELIWRRSPARPIPCAMPTATASRSASCSPLEARTTDLAELFRVRMRLAWQLLDAGEPDEALKEYDAIQQDDGRTAGPAEGPEGGGLAHLQGDLRPADRRERKLLQPHNPDSCLFPVHGGGIHRLQRGSRLAVATLTELLEKYPATCGRAG
jgi:hypothetical protein